MSLSPLTRISTPSQRTQPPYNRASQTVTTGVSFGSTRQSLSFSLPSQKKSRWAWILSVAGADLLLTLIGINAANHAQLKHDTQLQTKAHQDDVARLNTTINTLTDEARGRDTELAKARQQITQLRHTLGTTNSVLSALGQQLEATPTLVNLHQWRQQADQGMFSVYAEHGFDLSFREDHVLVGSGAVVKAVDTDGKPVLLLPTVSHVTEEALKQNQAAYGEREGKDKVLVKLANGKSFRTQYLKINGTDAIAPEKFSDISYLALPQDPEILSYLEKSAIPFATEDEIKAAQGNLTLISGNPLGSTRVTTYGQLQTVRDLEFSRNYANYSQARLLEVITPYGGGGNSGGPVYIWTKVPGKTKTGETPRYQLKVAGIIRQGSPPQTPLYAIPAWWMQAHLAARGYPVASPHAARYKAAETKWQAIQRNAQTLFVQLLPEIIEPHQLESILKSERKTNDTELAQAWLPEFLDGINTWNNIARNLNRRHEAEHKPGEARPTELPLIDLSDASDTVFKPSLPRDRALGFLRKVFQDKNYGEKLKAEPHPHIPRHVPMPEIHLEPIELEPIDIEPPTFQRRPGTAPPPPEIKEP